MLGKDALEGLCNETNSPLRSLAPGPTYLPPCLPADRHTYVHTYIHVLVCGYSYTRIYTVANLTKRESLHSLGLRAKGLEPTVPGSVTRALAPRFGEGGRAAAPYHHVVWADSRSSVVFGPGESSLLIRELPHGVDGDCHDDEDSDADDDYYYFCCYYLLPSPAPPPSLP